MHDRDGLDESLMPKRLQQDPSREDLKEITLSRRGRAHREEDHAATKVWRGLDKRVVRLEASVRCL
jgi:hypothetical protein